MNIATLALAALVLSGGAACAQSSIPDPARTPGAVDPAVTQENIQQTICAPGYTKTVRPPAFFTNAIKARQMLTWNLTGDHGAYEEDHLVPLEVGGSPRSVDNLWPEPWTPSDDQAYGAGEKDQLENEVHRLVCSGQMTLADGQRMFAPDWRSAYDALVGGR